MLPTAHPLVGTERRRLMLASASPRRRELLARLGVDFAVVVPDVDETPAGDERAAALVERLAAAKAVAVSADEHDAVVLGADTVVEVDGLNGLVLGKPRDAGDARRMLRLLSGRTHRVHTAVAVAEGGAVRASAATVTEVDMAELSNQVVDWYVGTGEPLDKAGAYALQGVGGVFVEAVRGSVSGVLGLPLDVTVRLLSQGS